MKKSKNKKKVLESVDLSKIYEPLEAIKILKENSYVKFQETLEVAINLSIDTKKTDQNIRGMLNLPKGTGKKIRVAVITKGDKVSEAKDAGADLVGDSDLVDKITSGKIDFDLLIATPDMMPSIGKIAKILGPKGLMPNPKSGTVTMDVAKAVSNLKAGMVELRVEKTGIVHTTCGKVSFEQNALVENILTIYNTLAKARPPSVKGQFMEKISLSSTMGPGVKININSIG